MAVKKREILKFFILPRFIPRMRELFASGFTHIAVFMAQIYALARLLPYNHPYLQAANAGRFGVRHVIAEARVNLKFSKENIDQIIIFFTLLIGLTIIAIQCAMLIGGFTISAAEAAMPTNFAGFFGVPAGQSRDDDVAYILMDRVFGLPNFFNSCVAQQAVCHNNLYAEGTYPYPFHVALRQMFALYSIGLLVVAALIFLYFLIAIIVETAQSGTPFGKRFNHLWVPLRIVAAIGLLIPITHGLNSGQWILMYAAKWGSNFATNGWNIFVDTATQMPTATNTNGETIAGSEESLIAIPNPPQINTLMEFGTVLGTCMAYNARLYPAGGPDGRDIKAWLTNVNKISSMNYFVPLPNSFNHALSQNNYKDIVITFGATKNRPNNNDSELIPYCGKLRLSITDLDSLDSPGSKEILEAWYNIIVLMWNDVNTPAPCSSVASIGFGFRKKGECIVDAYQQIDKDDTSPVPNADDLKDLRDEYKRLILNGIQNGVQTQRDSANWINNQRDLGWGGAAVWYNKIAQLNGSLIGVANNLPMPMKYPMLMEEVKKWRDGQNASTAGLEKYNPTLSDGTPFRSNNLKDLEAATALYNAQKIWADSYVTQKPTGNIFIDVVNLIFGTSGLFNIHTNAEQGVHPLALLAGIGKSLVQSSIANVGSAAVGGVGGGIANLLGYHTAGSFAGGAAGFAFQTATIGFMIGFLLYYVIPFLPFIYFFFAVGGWIKGIFEAMVGIPLWALAHIRIDGQGFSGDAAIGGYFLILEVFLRPILIIFGMIGGITIYAAQIEILNNIWSLVTSNVTGFDETCNSAVINSSATCNPGTGTGTITYLRSAIDTFFFTIIFAIICYMAGLSSFKMVDQVPNHILRWLGRDMSTFGEQNTGDLDNIPRNVAVGGGVIGSSLKQSVGGMKQVGGIFSRQSK